MSSHSHPHQEKECCPLPAASELLGDTWVLLIVQALLEGPKRYGELETTLNGHDSVGDISSRTLCARLKMLEEVKIVKKKVFKETPPRTEYRLTEKGEALSGIINEVRNFGAKYLV